MHSSSQHLLRTMVGRGGPCTIFASSVVSTKIRLLSRWTTATASAIYVDPRTVTTDDDDGLACTRKIREPSPSTSTRRFFWHSGSIHNHHRIVQRNFRSGFPSPEKATPTDTATSPTTPLDADEFQSKIMAHVPSMAASLLQNGYYTTTDLLPMSTIERLRQQSVSLRFDHHRFEASYSEKVDEATGKVTERFDKEGVYACEPDGQDYYDATDLITYMSLLLQTLPESLNAAWEAPTTSAAATTSVAATAALPILSSASFNAKLAVTEHGGAKYPLHVDNPQGLAAGDTRKLTCILYLNPDHSSVDGGEIRLFLPTDSESKRENENEASPWQTLDLSPIGGRLLVFWSDEIPHEVLPTSSASQPASTQKGNSHHDKDRYALTIWIPTSDAACLHNASSKFHELKDLVFAANNSGDSNNNNNNISNKR